MTIKQFSKTDFPIIRNDINAALAAVATKYGIKIEAGNVSFTDTTATMKLELRTTDMQALVAKAKKDLSFYGGAYGLKAEHYGTVVHTRAHGKMTFVGLDLKRHKYPIRMLKGEKVTLFTDAIVELIKAEHAKVAA